MARNTTHDGKSIFSLCGYTAMIGRGRSPDSPRTSTVGFTICLIPLNRPIRPNTATIEPTFNDLARYGWLKKTSDKRPLASETVAVTLEGPRRDPGGGAFTAVSSPMTRMSTPSAASAMGASRVRSIQRRG